MQQSRQQGCVEEALANEIEKMAAVEENEPGEPPHKNPRVLSEFEKLYCKLQEKGILKKIKLGVKALCTDKNNALAALKILYCNAAAGYGVNFTKSCCETEIFHEEYYPFGSVFLRGMEVFHKFFNDTSSLSEDEEFGMVLKTLLYFFVDEESERFIMGLTKKKVLTENKGHLATALFEHLLKKLSFQLNCTLDNRQATKIMECRCGCHTTVKNKFGDTTIGHHSVWHGSVDILLDKLPVTICGQEEGETYCLDEDYRSLDDFPTKQQMLAQTIVFSFLQKKMHPDLQYAVIPCVGISPTDLVFYFYDSTYDVLLRSKIMPLQLDRSINYEAVIALWLVLNYVYLGSGLSPQLKEAPASNFHTAVGNVIHIYRNDLTLGDISYRERPRKFEPALHRTTKFVWPPEFPNLNWDV